MEEVIVPIVSQGHLRYASGQGGPRNALTGVCRDKVEGSTRCELIVWVGFCTYARGRLTDAGVREESLAQVKTS